MFVYLSKLLPQLVYPLGLAFILLWVAIFIRKHPRLRTAVLVLVTLLIFLSGNRWVALSMARSLEWQYLPKGELPAADVIVLLGGGTDPALPPRRTVELNGAGDRVIYAAALYKQGKAPAVLASGGNITWLDSSRPSTPASEMADLLEFMGVPQQAVWLQPDSQNTHEDAVYSAKILKEKGITRILLVTSAVHMPRSVALFQKQGLEVIPAPADFSVTEQGWKDLTQADLLAQLSNLMPSAGNISLTTNVLREYFGMIAYRLKGWI